MAIIPGGGLRILICEDEYLLAMDLATQAKSHGASDVAILSSLAELESALADPQFSADVAFLDFKSVRHSISEIVPSLQDRNVSVVFCSGYRASECPEEFSHLPWLAKPFRVEDFSATLHIALNARSAGQSD